jgi:hypothetical protein
MILVKTETGQQVFKDRSVRLIPRQRSAFILFDGKRSVAEILEACAGITQEDIDEMIERGLLGRAGQAVPRSGAADAPAPRFEPSDFGAAGEKPLPPVPPTAAETAPAGGRSPQQRYKDAYPIATRLTGSLGLRGFRLNLAVEGTTSYEELLALAPKIRAAVGPEKAATLDRALGI